MKRQDDTADPLLIVDVQRCFLNDFTRHIPGRIRRLVDRGGFDPILFTRFTNLDESPYRRFLDWHACGSDEEVELAAELADLMDDERIYTKPGLTGLPDPLRQFLQEQQIERVHLVGIDTDMCVLKIAMDVFDLGIEPIVYVDCCASTAGLQAHLAGLAVLSRNIGPFQLRDAGLGEGYIAAH